MTCQICSIKNSVIQLEYLATLILNGVVIAGMYKVLASNSEVYA